MDQKGFVADSMKPSGLQIFLKRQTHLITQKQKMLHLRPNDTRSAASYFDPFKTGTKADFGFPSSIRISNVGSSAVSMDHCYCKFAHRRNKDGTFDSVCMDCLQAVASERNEDGLSRFERDHICNPLERDHF